MVAGRRSVSTFVRGIGWADDDHNSRDCQEVMVSGNTTIRLHDAPSGVVSQWIDGIADNPVSEGVEQLLNGFFGDVVDRPLHQ